MKLLEFTGLVIFLTPVVASILMPFIFVEYSEEAFVVALVSMIPCSYLSIKAIDLAN